MSIIMPLVEKGMIFIGAWPGISTKKFFLPLMGLYLSSLIFQIWNLVDVMGQLDLLMNNLATTMPVTLIVLKLIVLKRKFEKVKILISDILGDWENEKSNVIRRVMAKNTRIAVILTNVVAFCYNGLVLFFVIIAIMSYNSKPISKRQFIIQATYPGNTKKSPLFEIICIMQFVVAFFGTNGHAVLEGLLTISVLHANTKAFSVCQEISNYSDVCLSTSNKNNLLEARHKLIQRHSEFLNFTDCIQDIFAYVSFVHLYLMTLINCIVGYMLINVTSIDQDNIFTLFMCIAYIFTALSAVLSYCVAGEYLTSQGTLIFEELYKCPWYKFKPFEMRILILVIMRSRQPITITCGNFGSLSLIYFTKIIKTSFSYLSLVRAASK